MIFELWTWPRLGQGEPSRQ